MKVHHVLLVVCVTIGATFSVASSLRQRWLDEAEHLMGSPSEALNTARAQRTRAIDLYRRVLTISEVRYGMYALEVAPVLDQLGYALRAAGDLEAASQHYERALRIRESHLGIRHPDLLRPLYVLGNVHFTRGRWEAAEAAGMALDRPIRGERDLVQKSEHFIAAWRRLRAQRRDPSSP